MGGEGLGKIPNIPEGFWLEKRWSRGEKGALTSRRLNVVVRSPPLYPRGGPKWRDNYDFVISIIDKKTIRKFSRTSINVEMVTGLICCALNTNASFDIFR